MNIDLLRKRVTELKAKKQQEIAAASNREFRNERNRLEVLHDGFAERINQLHDAKEACGTATAKNAIDLDIKVQEDELGRIKEQMTSLKEGCELEAELDELEGKKDTSVKGTSTLSFR